jgi:colicin import membrane protein
VNRSALLGSTLMHAFAIWALFFFAMPGRIRMPPQAITVALVNLPTGAFHMSQGTTLESPPPKQDTPDVKQKVDTAPPDKNSVRPPDAKAPVPNRPKQGVPSAAKTDTAPLGVSGLSGDVSVDASDFEFTYYLIQVRSMIGRNWGAPAGLVTKGEPVRCTVYFKIDRLGRVTDVKLEDASGVQFFDQSALRAVNVSSPLPPLPAGYGGSNLGVHFGFQYVDR